MTAALIDAPPMTYRECHWCHRPMRRHGQRARAHPGTVAGGARGLCTTCYHRGAYPTAAWATRPYTGRPDELVEDADWLTNPDNFVISPLDVAARLGFPRLGPLLDALRKARAEPTHERHGFVPLADLVSALHRTRADRIVTRLQQRAADG